MPREAPAPYDQEAESATAWPRTQDGCGDKLSTTSAVMASCIGAAGVQDHPATQQESSLMRKGKAVGVDADLEVRIAQIEQMTLDQIGAF